SAHHPACREAAAIVLPRRNANREAVDPKLAQGKGRRSAPLGGRPEGPHPWVARCRSASRRAAETRTRRGHSVNASIDAAHPSPSAHLPAGREAAASAWPRRNENREAGDPRVAQGKGEGPHPWVRSGESAYPQGHSVNASIDDAYPRQS